MRTRFKTLLKSLRAWFRPAPMQSGVPPPSESQMLALESRILFDAAALLAGLDAYHTDSVNHLLPDGLPPVPDTLPVPAAVDQLVVVDPSISGWRALVDGMQSTVTVAVLDPQRDGVEQIGTLLAQYHDLSALHLFSHGAEGVVQVGTTLLSAQNADQYAATLHAWGQALASEGDILIYGCDVGAGAAGSALLTSVARLTGADVAASDNPTGAAALGGDWHLERHVGLIEADNPLPARNMAAFATTLAAPVALPGVQDQGVQLNGTNAWVDIPTAAIKTATGTVSLWFKVADNTSGVYDGRSSIIIGSPPAAAVEPLDLYLDGAGGAWNLRAVVGGQFADYSGFGVIRSNTWHHLALVWNGSGSDVYLNGEKPTPSPLSLFNSADLGNTTTSLGVYYDHSLPTLFPGAIAEVRTWSVAKTQAELRTDMATATLTGTEANLLSYYRFGSTGAVDSSGHHANATPTNVTWILPPNEDTNRTLTLGGFDADADVITARTIATLPSHGSLYQTADGSTPLGVMGVGSQISDSKGRVVYVPNANYNGSENFTFTVTAGGQTSTAATVTFSLTAVNDAPTVANAIAAQNATEKAAFTYVVPANTFADVDVGDTLTYSATRSDGSALPGWVTFTSGTRTFGGTPANADVGSVSVRVKATDSGGLTANSDFTLTVIHVNDPPSGTNKTITINEDTAYSLAVADFGFVDVDAADTLSQVRITQLPTTGNLTLSGVAVTLNQVIAAASLTAGNLRFTPLLNQNGHSYDNFKFQVQDGTVYAALANTLTITVTAVNDPPTLGNIRNMAVDLDGNNDHLRSALPTVGNLIATNDITIELAARVDDLRGYGTWSRLIDATFNSNNFLQINVPTDGRVQFTVEDAGTQRAILSNFVLTEGVWYHFAGVWHAASNQLEFFINGQPQNTAKFGDAAAGNTPEVRMGSRVDNQGHMQGAEDEVRIWSVARTQAEILANMHLALTGHEANLAAYWSFDEGQGSSSYDWSGGGRAMTMANMNPATDWIDSGWPITENVATTDKIWVLEDGQRLLQVGYATDVDNAPATLGYRITTLPNNGVLYQYNAGVKGAVLAVGDLLTDPSQRFFWEPALSYTGTDTLQFKANDGALDSLGAVTINLVVDPVNDAPVNVVPAAQTLPEDALLLFGTTSGKILRVDDVDVGGAALRVTLTANKGVVSLSQVTGLTFTTGDGTSDVTMTFTGSQTNINAALEGASFLPNAEYIGAASLTITSNDQGNSGAGGALSDTDVINITVVPSADLPGVTPVTATTNEDTQTAGFLIKRSALDGAEVTAFKITNMTGGTLYQADGVTPIAEGQFITIAQGNAKPRFTPAANRNSLMAGAVFGFGVTASLSASDAGLGAGTVTVVITVSAVNDAPVNTVPATQTVNEDTAFIFKAASGNGVLVSDDASDDGSAIKATLTVSHGVLTTVGGSGATLGGNGTATVLITGTVAQINAELEGLTYQPSVGYFGTDTVQINTNDQGKTGSGGILTDIDSFTVTINPVADTPMVTTATTNEDTQTTTGLVLGRNTTDGVEVGFFKITNITGGTLYRNDGTTPIVNNTFITAAQGGAGVRFTPAANKNSAVGDLFSFTAQASLTAADTGLGGAAVTVPITVNSVNDVPVLVAGGSLAFTENAPDQVVDGTISVTDVDHASLTGAVVTISSGYQNGADRLNVVHAHGITGVWDGASGALTLSGAATLADYQAVLRTVTYGNSSEAPTAGVRTIRFVATDGVGSSLPVTATVTVTPVPDLPIITAGAVVTVTEGDAPPVVDATLTVADLDDVNLEGATLTFASGYHATEDVLTFTNANGITAAWNGVAGVLTVSGSATKADYQTALRGIRYVNTAGDTPTTGVRTLSWVVNDGDGNSAAAGTTLTMVAVNDRPVMTAGAVRTVTEGDGATVLDGTLTVTDPDNTLLTGAVVRVTTGFKSGEDQLAVTAANGITGSWDGATGVLTLSGSATLANYQGVLRSVTYFNLAGDVPTAGLRTFSYVVNDGALTSLPVTSTVNMVAVNDRPLLSAGALLTVVEGDAAAVVDATVTVIDVDDLFLEGATMRVVAGFVPGEDVLSFANTGAIVGSWNGGTGVLTLSGTATLLAYQQAFRSVTYSNAAGDAPTAGVRTIASVVNDGDTDSLSVTTTVNMIKVNDRPVVTVGGGVFHTEGVATTVVAGGITVVDPDHTQLQRATLTMGAGYVPGEDRLAMVNTGGISGLWDSATGALILSGTDSVANYQAVLRSVTYSNNAGDNPTAGGRSVQLVVDDGVDESLPVSVTVTVLPVNDAPTVITGGALSFIENAAATVLESGITVADPDNSLLTGATVTMTAGYVPGEDLLGFVNGNGINGSWNGAGVLTLNGVATAATYQLALRSVTYANTAGDTPTAGVRTVSWMVTDGDATSVAATTSVSVTAVNDAPVLTVPAAQTLLEDGTRTIAGVSLQDVDAGSGDLTWTLAVNHGRLTLGSIAGLSFTTGDGSDNPLLVVSGQQAALNAAVAALRYQGDANYNGADLLVLQVSDQGNSGSGGNRAATTTVAITVTPVQDPPNANIDVLTTPEDVPLLIRIATDLLVNDNDPDGDPLSVTGMTLPTHGVMVDHGNGTLTYTPVLDYNGTDAFVYTVSDGQGNSRTAVVTLVVEPIPDAFQMGADTLALDEDTPTQSSNLIGNDRDPDYHVALPDFGQNPAMAIIGFTPAAHGVLVYQGDGRFTYTPDANYFGTDGFSYTLNTGDARLGTGNVAITVAAMNDAPTWSVNTGLTVAEGAAQGISSLHLRASDSEQNATSLTFTLGVAPAEGVLKNNGVVLPAGGLFTQDDIDQNRVVYVHSGSETVADTFFVAVSDGVGGLLPMTPFTVTVQPVNDLPVLAINSGLNVNEGAAVTVGAGRLRLTDVDNTDGQLQLTVTTLPVHGLLRRSGLPVSLNGSVTQADINAGLVDYLHDGGETLSDGWQFTASDGAGGSIATQSVAITINAVNDTPVLVVNAGAILNEGGQQVVDTTLLASTDADNTATQLVFQVTALPDHGLLARNGVPLAAGGTVTQDDLVNKRLVYTHDGSETIADLFKFTLADGAGGTVGETTFAITLNPVNDAPLLTAGAVWSYVENDPATVVDGTITVQDVDNATLQQATVTVVGGDRGGEDRLLFVNTAQITGTWTAGSGVLTLTGAASPALYQAALRSVTYFNMAGDNPTAGDRTISLVVSDGSAASPVVNAVVRVVAVNDPPLLAAGGVVAYLENDPATLVATGLTLSDADNSVLVEATVRVSSGYQVGQDRLGLVTVGGVGGVWDASNGVLTLSGTATVMAYQTALRRVTYINDDGDHPTSGTRTLTFQADDGTANGSTVTSQVVVTAVNDAPVVTAGGLLVFVENSAAQVVDAGMTVVDPDNTHLEMVTLTITGYDVGQERLALGAVGTIVPTWNNATGQLTLLGHATLAEYQAALRQVTFINTSDNPVAGDRLVQIKGNDGQAESLVGSATVRVVAVNDRPGSSGLQPVSYTEGDADVVVAAGVVVTDPDTIQLQGATLAMTTGYVVAEDRLLYVPSKGINGTWDGGIGVLTLSGAATLADYQSALRSVTFKNSNSDAPTPGVRVLQMTLQDGSATSLVDTLSLTVYGVNDAPQLVPGAALTYTEGDGSVVLVPTITLIDPDDSTLQRVTVQFSTGYRAGEDLLALPAAGTLTTTWDPLAGLFGLSGVATVNDYQAALRRITYQNLAGDQPTAGNRTLLFLADDGKNSSLATNGTVQVVAVNDAPIMSGGATLAYTENDPARVIDATLTVVDYDHATLVGATVAIATGYVASEDRLAVANQGAISGTWNALTGILTLTGNATPAAYQAALASVTYQNSNPDTPVAGNRTIQYQVSDGLAGSAPVTSTVVVTVVNDRPVLTAGGVRFYTEGDPATIVDAGMTILDVDNSHLQHATVAMTDGYHAGIDQLNLANSGTFVTSWNSASGVLTVSGLATVAAYQAALRGVTYSNLGGDNPTPGVLTVSFTVGDGQLESLPATAALHVVVVNDPPVVTVGGGLVYQENAAATVLDPLFGVTDPDHTLLAGATVSLGGTVLSDSDLLGFTAGDGISGIWDATAKTVTLTGSASVVAYQNALRSVTYVNTNGNDPIPGVRTVTVTVSDGTDNSIPVSTSVTVQNMNDAPVITVPGAQAGQEDVTLSIAGLGVADVDVEQEAGVLAVALTVGTGRLTLGNTSGLTLSSGGNGQASMVVTGSLTAINTALQGVTYRGLADYFGNDTLLIQVSDQGGSGAGGAKVDAKTVAITLAPVQDAPLVGGDVILSMDEDTPLPINVATQLLINDSDVDGDPLQAGGLTQTAHGTLVDHLNGTLTYTPQPHFNGVDGFTYVLSDGQGGQAVGTVILIIKPVSDALVAGADRVLVTEDTPLVTGNLLVNDWDPDYHVGLGDFGLNPALAVISFTPTINGVVSYHGNGTFAYTPNLNFFGTDQFTYILNTGDARIGQGTVTLTVAAVNDAPVLVRNAGVVVVEGEVEGVLLGSAALQATDVEQAATALRFTLGAVPVHGTLTKSGGLLSVGDFFSQDDLDQGRVRYQHDGSETTGDTFIFTVTDGVGATLFPTTFAITVTPSNDPPLLATNSGAVLLEGGEAEIGTVLLRVTDSDNVAAQLTFILSGIPAHGVLTRSGLTLGVGDRFTQADVDHMLLRYRHDGGETISDRFSFTVADGAGGGIGVTSFALAVTPVNDAPVLVVRQPLTLDEGGSAVLARSQLVVSDPEQGPAEISFRLTQIPRDGVLRLSGQDLLLNATFTQADIDANRLSYYHGGGEQPADGFKLIVSDGVGGTIGETDFQLILIPRNDAPQATAGATLLYLENAPATAVDGTITVNDVDNSTLQGAVVTVQSGFRSGEDYLAFANRDGIVATWSDATGALTLTGSATLAVYQAALRTVTYYNTSDNPGGGDRIVRLVVRDGSASSSAVTSVVRVVPVNDAPTLTAGGLATFTEKGLVQRVDPGILVADVDNTYLERATVTITGGYEIGQDRLAVVDGAITGVWSGADGRLTLLGHATLAEYQAALRSVTFSNGSERPLVADRLLQLVVNDGAADSLIATATVRVAAVNDRPVLTGLVAGSYTEGAVSTLVAAAAVVGDVDNDTLQGATLAMTDGYVAAEDQLLFLSGNGITGVWDDVVGVLTLSGTATLTDYQAVLHTVAFANRNVDQPHPGNRTITVTVHDGVLASTAQSLIMTVQGVNDAPQLTTGAVLAYTEGDGVVRLDPALTVRDLDDVWLQGATVQLTTGYRPGEDLLAVVPPAAITATWESATGRLDLRGTATLADYQTALRAVTYANLAGDNPVAGQRTLLVWGTDGQANSLVVQNRIMVTAVNDAPFLTGGATLAYAENDPARVIDATLTVTDLDNATLAGATVDMVGYVAGEDQLRVGDPGLLGNSWNAATGVLTLTGVATPAAYQAALASVTYWNSNPDTPIAGSRGIRFWVHDGAIASAGVSSTVVVTAVDDRPVITAGEVSVYTEGDAARVVATGLTVLDVDDTHLDHASVAIVSGYQSGMERLNFTDSGPLIGTWDTATGVLTVSGSAPLAVYQAALRGMTYSNLAGDQPSAGQRTIVFTVNDGERTSLPATATIQVVAVNDLPVVTVSGDLTYTENAAATVVTTAITLVDPDDAFLTGATVVLSGTRPTDHERLEWTAGGGISGVWTESAGTLTLTGRATLAAYQGALRSVAYINPNGDAPLPGGRTLTFTVNDGHGNSTPVTTGIQVVAVNDAPVLTVPGGQSAYEDLDLSITGLRVQDVDLGQTGAVAVALAVTNGRLSLGNSSGLTFLAGGNGQERVAFSGSLAAVDTALATLTYRGRLNFFGTDTLQVQVSDQGWSGSGGVQTASGEVTIAVAPVQDAPVSGGDVILLTDEDLFLVINVASKLLANDVDVDGDPLRASAFTTPTHGRLVDNQNGTLTYTPDPDFNGVDGFNYTLSDDHGGSDLGKVVIIVNPVQDALRAGPDAVLLPEDTVVVTTNLLANDRDPDYHVGLGDFGLNPALAVIGFTPTAHGVVVYNDNGTFTYTPSANFFGSDTLTYTLHAGDTRIGRGVVTWTVEPVNDAPLLVHNQGVLLAEGSSAVVAVTALQATDVEQSASDLLYTLGAVPVHGSLFRGPAVLAVDHTFSQADIDQGRIRYQHDGSESRVDTFRFVVSDGAGAQLFPSTFVLTMIAVNDEPVLLTNAGAILLEGGTVLIDHARLRVTDTDNTPGQLTFDLLTLPAYGSLVLDGAPLLSGRFTQADLDSGRVVYRHAGGELLGDGFDFTVTDGAGGGIAATHFTLTTIAVNDAPRLAVQAPLWLDEGSSAVVDTAHLTVTDAEQGAVALQYRLTQIPQHGTLSWRGQNLGLNSTFTQADIDNNLLVYTHHGDEVPNDGFNYTVVDGVGGVIGETVFDLRIRPVNDAPVVNSHGTLDYTEHDAARIVAGNLTLDDVDDTTLAGATVSMGSGFVPGEDWLAVTPRAGVTMVWEPQVGVLTLRGVAQLTDYQTILRSVTYVNMAGDAPSNGTRVVTVVVTDGKAVSAAVNNVIQVHAVNDRPVVQTGGVLAYREGDGQQAVFSTLTVQDVDDASLVGATVVLSHSAHFDRGEERLVFADGGGIVGVWSATQQTLSLMGRATAAQYQEALRRVVFVNENLDDPIPGQHTLTVTVRDGSATSAATTSMVVVTAVNDPPQILLPGSQSVAEDQPQRLDPISLRDVDAGDALVRLSLMVAHGTLTLAGSGVLVSGDGQAMITLTGSIPAINQALAGLRYQGVADFNGADPLLLQANDLGHSGSGSGLGEGRIAITVRPVEDIPVAGPDVLLTPEDQSLRVDVAQALLANDFDADGDVLVVRGLTQPQHGVLTDQGNGQLIYTPNANYNGTDHFLYKISDGHEEVFGTVTVVVEPIPDALVARPDTVIGHEDQPVTFNVLANDWDPDDRTSVLQVVGFTTVVHGKRTGNGDGRFTYIPEADFNGVERFSYTISSGDRRIASGDVVVTVLPENDWPWVQVNTGLFLKQGEGATIFPSRLHLQDVDNSAAEITLILTTAPLYGTLQVDSRSLAVGARFTQAELDQGRVRYQHGGASQPQDSFWFTATDGLTGMIAATRFEIDVQVAMPPPVLPERTFLVDELFTAPPSEVPPGRGDGAFPTLTAKGVLPANPGIETPTPVLTATRFVERTFDLISARNPLLTAVMNSNPGVVDGNMVTPVLTAVQEGGASVAPGGLQTPVLTAVSASNSMGRVPTLGGPTSGFATQAGWPFFGPGFDLPVGGGVYDLPEGDVWHGSEVDSEVDWPLPDVETVVAEQRLDVQIWRLDRHRWQEMAALLAAF